MPKKPTNPEHNTAIAETIDLFKSINPATVIMFGNKTERRDALQLHKLYGEKIKDIVAFLPIYNVRVKEFYQATTPHTTLKNVSKIFEIKRKYDADQKYLKEQVEKDLQEAKEAEHLRLLREQKPTETKQRFNNIMDIIKNA